MSDDGVVFVHGNPGSARHWEPFAAAAGEAIGGGPVLAPTLPGFSGAPVPRGFGYTVEAYADWLAGAIDDAGIGRAHLVLHDFGGGFGLMWAARHPSRVASLTLIDTGVLQGYRWHALARIWRTPVLGEAFQATTTRAAFDRVIDRGQARPLPAHVKQMLWEDGGGATRRTVLKLYRNTPAARFEELMAELAPLDPPTLVLWGERDPYLPADHAQRQRDAFPQAEVHVLPGLGHWPYAEEPELVGGLLTSFLSKVVATHA